MLLALRPSHKRIDIYNDLDTNLTNFFLCAKERTNELVRELKYLPIHSRTAFHLYKHFLEHEEYHRMVYEQNIQKELEVLEDRSCFTAEQAEELRPVLSERFQHLLPLPQQRRGNPGDPSVLRQPSAPCSLTICVEMRNKTRQIMKE